MKKLLCVFALLALVLPVQGAYVVRVSDLQYSPTPPNPIKVAGCVVSSDPVKLTDGSGVVTVVGTSASVADFLVVTGDWDGSVLTVRGLVDHVLGSPPSEMVYVPTGEFLMGNNGNEPYSPPDELPQHPRVLAGYFIGRYEVTRAEYERFMSDGGYSNAAYWSAEGWEWKESTNRAEPAYWASEQEWASLFDNNPPQPFVQTGGHPVVGVTYFEADAYCRWAGGHLPSEAQWEKAARWDGTARVYPWGNALDTQRCNNWYDTRSLGFQTAPVGSYPSGMSPYGCYDMAGNLWEWCSDWYVSYPGSQWPFNYTGQYKVLRGGSWTNGILLRCAVRNYGPPADSAWALYAGFRLCY